MKIWSGVLLMAAGWVLSPGAGPSLSLEKPPVLLGGLRFLAMSGCTEFPAEPLLEPKRDAGGAPDGADGGSDSEAPDTANSQGPDVDLPEDASVPDARDDPGSLPFDALDQSQEDAFCGQVEARAGLPAPAALCGGRTVWSTGISCEVTVDRLAECGATLGAYDACLDRVLDDACALLRAPACAETFDCLGTGLALGAAINDLPQEQYARLCRWGAESIGEEREFFCDGVIRVTTHTVADCEEHDRAACDLTVREYEACAAEIRDDICQVLHAPACAAFRDCFGPEL